MCGLVRERWRERVSEKTQRPETGSKLFSTRLMMTFFSGLWSFYFPTNICTLNSALFFRTAHRKWSVKLRRNLDCCYEVEERTFWLSWILSGKDQTFSRLLSTFNVRKMVTWELWLRWFLVFLLFVNFAKCQR